MRDAVVKQRRPGEPGCKSCAVIVQIMDKNKLLNASKCHLLLWNWKIMAAWPYCHKCQWSTGMKSASDVRLQKFTARCASQLVDYFVFLGTGQRQEWFHLGGSSLKFPAFKWAAEWVFQHTMTLFFTTQNNNNIRFISF